jgi:hypothetical protein
MIQARKVINTETVYSFLEESFLSVVNILKGEEKISLEASKFVLFKDQADFDGTLKVNTYASDDEAQKKNYGIFRFMGGTVDTNRKMNIYLHRYSFELLNFEIYRDDIKVILTTMASSLNGNAYTLTDENGTFTSFAQVSEFPVISEEIDANGDVKFLATVIIDLLFYSDMVHSSDTTFLLDGVEVPYTEIKMVRRMEEPTPNITKSYESTYLPTRSTFAISILGYYQINQATENIIDWLVDESRLSFPVRLFYTDGYKVKTGAYIIDTLEFTYPYQGLINYSVQLVPLAGAVKAYYGVLAKNALGTNEYLVGATVELNSEDEAFSGWEIESGDLTLTPEQLAATPLTFVMPASDLIIKAKLGD